MGLETMVKKILYLCADLRPVGPTRQTLNIIKYSGVKDNGLVLTLFPEINESLKPLYESLGIRVECLNLHRKLFIFNAVSAIKNFCQKENIAAIHSYGVKPDIVAHYAAKKIGIKHIITLRNFPMEDLSGRMNPYVGKIIALIHLHILKQCKYLIACSKTIAAKMREAYNVKITPIQNGVDIMEFNKGENTSKDFFHSNFRIKKESKIFICTNSFIPRKHNHDIAEAFIAANLKNAELFFLGDGFLLEKMRAKYSKFTNIHFLGKRSDVRTFLQNADCFISASESEGLPNAVLEALACGCPVLLSDIPQHREILDILKNSGNIFELSNIEELKFLIKNFPTKEFYGNIIENLRSSPFVVNIMGKIYSNYYSQVFKN